MHALAAHVGNLPRVRHVRVALCITYGWINQPHLGWWDVRLAGQLIKQSKLLLHMCSIAFRTELPITGEVTSQIVQG